MISACRGSSVSTVKIAVLALTILSALALNLPPSPAAAAAPRAAPQWLKDAEARTLSRSFGGATPVRRTYIGYRRKVAVVWEFERVVVCRLCSAPSNAQRPRGRVIRVSYDRTTHRQGNAMQFCEVENRQPPLAACLRR
jgi:hypothetical protein